MIFALLGISLTALIFGWLIYSGKRTSRIEQHGTPGQAIVLSVFDNGLSSGTPIIRFTCQVTLDGTGDSFKADTSPFVRRTTSASFYIGQTVAVRANPRKRTEFYIVDDSQLFYADAEHP